MYKTDLFKSKNHRFLGRPCTVRSACEEETRFVQILGYVYICLILLRPLSHDTDTNCSVGISEYHGKRHSLDMFHKVISTI